jgi:hypothetical protein
MEGSVCKLAASGFGKVRGEKLNVFLAVTIKKTCILAVGERAYTVEPMRRWEAD